MKTEWLPTVLTIVLGFVTLTVPFAQEWINDHPGLATAIVTAYAALKGVLPSPISKGNK